VLLGSTSESTRAQESLKLLNWGFQSFDAVKLYGAGQTVKQIEVWKGEKRQLKTGFESDLVLTVPKGQAEKIKAELIAVSPLVAPVASGQRIGSLRVSLDGKSLGEYPVHALDGIPEAGFLSRAWDTLRLWLK
jgi:D-alanyl-D-alanine carboxypeptidase (penicillin-binding protein 5/6)